MSSNKRAGRIIGMLLLVQLATGLIVPYVFLRPLTLLPVAFLAAAARMPGTVRLNVLMLLVGGAVSLAISVAAWPAVRERSRTLGLWLLALSVANFILQINENAHWLTMLSVSQAYADAGATEAAYLLTLGIAVRAAWKWAHYSHILVVVGWLFALYLTLFRCAIVPRALAVLGMFTGLMQVAGITLPAFGGYRMPFPMLFGMPLGVVHIALAAWLMTNGIRVPHESPRTGGGGVEILPAMQAGRVGNRTSDRGTTA